MNENNISKILSSYPVGTQLYSPAYGNCLYQGLEANGAIRLKKFLDGNLVLLPGNGIITDGGELMLYPSRNMRDWSKFAWKKGDVLKVATGGDCSCIFDRFTNDDYTEFTGVFDKYLDRFDCFSTSNWSKVTDEKEYESIIQRIETQYGGTLNLDTLTIEKPQFKDGDIVRQGVLKGTNIYIIKTCIDKTDNKYDYYARYNTQDKEVNYNNWSYLPLAKFATDSEKQQLFDALAKVNKAWDAEKKAIVDLPKKCEFKPFDKVLVRDNDMGCVWNAAFFSHKDEKYFVSTGFHGWQQCIPYNDQTAHLLGTTDDWKGGEG